MDGDGAGFGELEYLLLDGHGHSGGGLEFLPSVKGMVPGFYAGDDGLGAIALLDVREGDGVCGEECVVFHACGGSVVMYWGCMAICRALGRRALVSRVVFSGRCWMLFWACQRGYLSRMYFFRSFMLLFFDCRASVEWTGPVKMTSENGAAYPARWQRCAVYCRVFERRNSGVGLW